MSGETEVLMREPALSGLSSDAQVVADLLPCHAVGSQFFDLGVKASVGVARGLIEGEQSSRSVGRLACGVQRVDGVAGMQAHSLSNVSHACQHTVDTPLCQQIVDAGMVIRAKLEDE